MNLTQKISMDIPELRNPFSSGKIISADTDPAVYKRTTGGERGSREFIMSSSGLREFAVCARKWQLGGEPEAATDATEWGTLVDSIALSPGQFETRFSVTPETYPDSKTGEQKPWTFAANYCKDWRRDQGDKTIVKHNDFSEAQKASSRLLEDDEIAELIKNSYHQVMVLAEYRDRETGIIVPVKGLIDGVPDFRVDVFGNALWDLKTLRDASLHSWKKDVFYRGYHTQGAFYLWLYNSASNGSRESFLHILSENVAPYETARRILTSEFLDMGRRFVLGALRYYCQCLGANTWPDYDAGLDGYHGWAFTAPDPGMILAEMSFPDLNASEVRQEAPSEMAS